MQSHIRFGARAVVLLGALQWGLIGLGILLGQSMNFINILLRPWPLWEAVVYLVIGVAALLLLVLE